MLGGQNALLRVASLTRAGLGLGRESHPADRQGAVGAEVVKTSGETEARRAKVLPEAMGKEEERGGCSARKLPAQLLPCPREGRVPCGQIQEAIS